MIPAKAFEIAPTMNSLQPNRGIVLTTALGPDALLPYRMNVQERLSRPFEISLELLSAYHNLDLSSVLGTAASIEIDLRG